MTIVDGVDDSVEARYASLRETASKARALKQNLESRLMIRRMYWFLYPQMWRKENRNLARQIGNAFHAYDPDRIPPPKRDLLKNLATSKQKDDPLFATLTNEYPLEDLARGIIRAQGLKSTDVAALLELHRLKSKSIASFKPLHIVGAMLAAGSLAAKAIPKEAFRYMHWSFYDAYQAWISIAVVLVTIYLTFILLPAWFMMRKHLQDLEFCETLLIYCSLHAQDL